MGVVFEADDGVRGELVALKRLRRSSAFDLYQFKREFRSLADVVHRNLVCLYELFVEETCAFFTMELVDGMGFVEHVRDAGRPQERGQRLTDASRQLVAGLSFLHDRGKLHRDIKPSNVLVTPTGRVVILDFGLVADRLPASVADLGYLAGGTPAYMSPEEAAGAPPSEAGDWYAVGVTLYESLTGGLPFSGSPREVLLRKQAADPPPPERLEPAAPSRLSEVCMGLLRRDPAKRLNGHAALAALERRVVARPADRAMPVSRLPTFVGRTQELESLEAALADVLAGVSSVVCLHGPSGIGKSALIERFFGQVETRGDVVVLAGRCYENESVPYKALDGVVDALARHLRSLTSDELAPLLPPDLPVLLQLFPVLGRVAAIADASDGRPIGGRDPLNLRLDAFAALRELLRRLARRQPLLVVIDDLQWADADSAVLLEHLFPAADAPVMLTVLAFRSEEIGAQPFLRSLLERAHRRPWSTLPVGPMTAADTDALLRALVAGTDVAETQRTQFAREAAGSPFVLEQLAWYRDEAGPRRDAPSLAEMLDGRLNSLPPSARRFLETLAMCGRPTPPELVCDACGVDHDRQSLVVTLRALRLVRSSGSLARVEPYHDRIREALTARMAPAAARSTHRGIAQALVARGVDDCDALFEHYRGAGDEENAALQAACAAEKAVRGLAFDRAASLYRHALARPPDQPSRQAWREGLAGALVNAGRPGRRPKRTWMPPRRRITPVRWSCAAGLQNSSSSADTSTVAYVCCNRRWRASGYARRGTLARRYGRCSGAGPAFAGAAWASRSGRPRTSTRRRCCGSTRAGRPPRAWRWST